MFLAEILLLQSFFITFVKLCIQSDYNADNHVFKIISQQFHIQKVEVGQNFILIFFFLHSLLYKQFHTSLFETVHSHGLICWRGRLWYTQTSMLSLSVKCIQFNLGTYDQHYMLEAKKKRKYIFIICVIWMIWPFKGQAEVNVWLSDPLRLWEQTSLTLPLYIPQLERFMIVTNQKVNVVKWFKSANVFFT